MFLKNSTVFMLLHTLSYLILPTAKKVGPILPILQIRALRLHEMMIMSQLVGGKTKT